MSTQPSLAVVSAGIVCSVGLSVPAASAAIRASLDSFQETYFVDSVGQPIIGAAVPAGPLGLGGDTGGAITGGEEKLARMFALAAAECLDDAGGLDAVEVALVLVGPDASRPGVAHDELEQRMAACEEALGRRFHAERRVIQNGRPGLVDALICAHELLAARGVRSVLIAGVDSLLNAEDINDALAGERLRTAENADGFIPGEAAACVLVTRADSAGAQRAPTLSIAGLGAAEEPDSWLSGRANVGRGLAQAIRQALAQAGLSAHAIHQRWSDCSGESFFFDEAAYAWGRVLRAPSPPGHRQWLLASSVGEVGAAAGPLMLALLLDAARRGWAPGPSTLVHLSSAGSARAALVTIASSHEG